MLAIVDHQIPKSIAFLELAVEENPREANLQSDLSASYIAKASADHSPLYYLKALAAAERASRAQKSLEEATFNRALALELLGITWEAKRAWSDYLRLDTTSPWSDEARQHLRTLDQPSETVLWTRQKPVLIQALLKRDQATLRSLVTRFRLRVRKYGEEVLLAEWAGLQMRGKFQEAGQVLEGARELGKAIARISGDQMLGDAVAAIDRGRVGDADLASLAEGYLGYSQGLHFYERHDNERAAIEFSKAQEGLLGSGSPLGLWAELYLAACLYQESHYLEAERVIAAIESRNGSERYPNLFGRTLWVKGLIEVVQSHYDLAYTAYKQALLLFNLTGESENVAAVQLLIFEYFYFMGEQEEGWRHLQAAVAMVDHEPDPRRQLVTLWGGTLAAMRANEPQIALYFQGEAIRIAKRSKEPAIIASSLRGRARVNQQAGLTDDALTDLSAAKEEISKIPSAETRRVMNGDVFLVEGDLLRSRSPKIALQALDQAIKTFRATKYHAELARALLIRARVFLVMLKPDHAEADFAAAVQEIEQERSAFSTPTARAIFLDGARALFDEAVAFYVNVLRRPDLAYGFVEQARGRALLDMIVKKPTTRKDHRPLTNRPQIDEIRRSIPQGVVLVQFGVLEDRVLVWALWRTGSRFAERAIGERALSQQVGNLRTAIVSHQNERVERLGENLYSVLLGDLFEGLPTQGIKVLIPDKSLHELPFAALRNPKSGKYLIEEQALEYAPSAEIYLNSTQSKRKTDDYGPLLVGNPAFDRNLLPYLPYLPGSVEEVGQILKVFGSGRILVGKSATKQAWLELAHKHNILHLATHAVIRQDSPMDSYIVLAPSADSGLLYAHEIYSEDFGRVDLVFLAGCETALGPPSESEGVFSLARPFLAAGVRSVVGTLWAVDDRAVSRFSVEFYLHLRAGDKPAEALRSSQLAMLASGETILKDPSVWASFEAIGRR